jgi:phosphoribosylanthranilate isomerase
MFQIKICGLTTPADARLAAEAGADAVGLNFVAGSSRRLDVAAARAVAAAVPEGVLRIGVFAGTPAAEIRRLVDDVGLDAVQLHGHLFGTDPATDPPERCGELAGIPVIRAVRLDATAPEGDALASARRWIAAARLAGAAPSMAIVDATVAVARETGPATHGGSGGAALGGTGAKVDWAALKKAAPLDIPIALAGGLTPDNVAEAIHRTGVRAVDTASGVESAPGRKDAAKMRAFVAAARGLLSPSAKSG